jgi:hypothetical protein
LKSQGYDNTRDNRARNYHIELPDEGLKVGVLKKLRHHFLRELLDLHCANDCNSKLNTIVDALQYPWKLPHTFLITMVSPFAPQPQQSAYSGELKISKVFVRKPGTDAIPESLNAGAAEQGQNDASTDVSLTYHTLTHGQTSTRKL